MFGIGKWFENKLHDSLLKDATKEMEYLISLLRSLPEEELGEIVVLITHSRLKNEKDGSIPRRVFENTSGVSKEELHRVSNYFLQMMRIIRSQKNDSAALAMMVWHGSFRALTTLPELRPSAVQMWAEIQRGYPFVTKAHMRATADPANRHLSKGILENARFVPPLLDPSNQLFQQKQ